MICAPTYSYSDSQFRAQFQQFESATEFSVQTLQMNWNTAGKIIANTTYGYVAAVGGSQAMNLMTAHLTALSVLIARGETPMIQTGATIDKITVSLEPPPVKGMFEYWLATTPYGMQLLALLEIASVGGLYAPGGLGRAGFAANGYNGRWGW